MTVIEAIKAFDIEKAITAVTDLVADAKKHLLNVWERKT